MGKDAVENAMAERDCVSPMCFIKMDAVYNFPAGVFKSGRRWVIGKHLYSLPTPLSAELILIKVFFTSFFCFFVFSPLSLINLLYLHYLFERLEFTQKILWFLGDFFELSSKLFQVSPIFCKMKYSYRYLIFMVLSANFLPAIFALKLVMAKKFILIW